MDGTTYFMCLDNKACQPMAFVPAQGCSQQCLFNSANPDYVPPACPDGTANMCPPGQAVYTCVSGGRPGGCRQPSDGFIPGCAEQVRRT